MQEQWDEESKGRHSYKIRQAVGKMKSIGGTPPESKL